MSTPDPITSTSPEQPVHPETDVPATSVQSAPTLQQSDAPPDPEAITDVLVDPLTQRSPSPGADLPGLGAEDLAERGDLDRTFPSLLERGCRSPTFFVILQLAYALRMEPGAFFSQAVARLRREGQS